MNKENITGNDFIVETRKILDKNKAGYNEKLFCRLGFEFVETEEPQECILVFGINPSGDETDAEKEENAEYLFYLPEESVIAYRTHTQFYKPIFDTLDKATNGEVKWGWCNHKKETIFERDEYLKDYKDIIEHYYDNNKGKRYSLYIGEFFYYHEDQSTLISLIDDDKLKLNKYIKDIFEMHIREIVSSGSKISLIWINNAAASQYLLDALNPDSNENCDDNIRSFYDYPFEGKQYRVFFGPMVSRTDRFSKARMTESATVTSKYF